MKRYPCRGKVSMNRGLSAESSNASRKRFTAAFKLWSKSTNVSEGHSSRRSSSRVTTSPGCRSKLTSIRKGCSCSLIFTPFLRSSAARKSTSKRPNRTVRDWSASVMYQPCRIVAPVAVALYTTPHSQSLVATYRFCDISGVRKKNGKGLELRSSWSNSTDHPVPDRGAAHSDRQEGCDYHPGITHQIPPIRGSAHSPLKNKKQAPEKQHRSPNI